MDFLKHRHSWSLIYLCFGTLILAMSIVNAAPPWITVGAFLMIIFSMIVYWMELVLRHDS